MAEEESCVFSPGGVFSPLSAAQAIQAACVCQLSVPGTLHIFPAAQHPRAIPGKALAAFWQHHWQLKSFSQGCEHPCFSKSPFLDPNSVLAQGLLWLLVLRVSPQPVGLTGQCHSSVNSSLMVNKGLIICVIFLNYQRKATALSPPRGCSVKHFSPH